MAAYAVGDLQGCFYSFRSLLEIISFDKDVDELWLVGDIVNRGMNSLEVIEWCYEHQKNIKLVLGNHDLHFLSIALSIISFVTSLLTSFALLFIASVTCVSLIFGFIVFIIVSNNSNF